MLTERILASSFKRFGLLTPLTFVGGRRSDNNTAERLRGFLDAHQAHGLTVPEQQLLVTGYSSSRVEEQLRATFPSPSTALKGLFVNSTISLEGVVRWLAQYGQTGQNQPPMGCFDWDPFVSLLGHDIDMVRQDVPAMLEKVFEILDSGDTSVRRIEIPPELIGSQSVTG